MHCLLVYANVRLRSRSADSSFVPPLVYALMGSSKDLAVGTVAVASLLISSMLGSEVSPTENPVLYLHLAFTATFFAGVFQASLGLLRYACC
jgi:sulfate transporter 3